MFELVRAKNRRKIARIDTVRRRWWVCIYFEQVKKKREKIEKSSTSPLQCLLLIVTGVGSPTQRRRRVGYLFLREQLKKLYIKFDGISNLVRDPGRSSYATANC